MAPELVGPRLRSALAAAGAATALAFAVDASYALDAPSTRVVPASSARAPVGETGVAWQDLTPAQKEFLQPLERDWASIEAPQKRKWIALTARVPALSVGERTRIQTRMTGWAQLTPDQRGEARLRYQEVRQVPAQDRQARWQAYQSLPPEQRRQLAERAAHAASSARRATAAASVSGQGAHEPLQAKSNIVTRPGPATQRRQVGPTLAQARPGATTTSISRPPAPPPHQQTGLPKIAATPEFVNKATLLPRRGPQAASARPASSASGPDAAASR